MNKKQKEEYKKQMQDIIDTYYLDECINELMNLIEEILEA
jgi:hypothetical protein